jgi:hypothetical protein
MTTKRRKKTKKKKTYHPLAKGRNEQIELNNNLEVSVFRRMIYTCNKYE